MTMPPHGPYDVEVGHPVEVRVFVTDEGKLRAEAEFEGDAFGAETTLDGSDLENIVTTDELVQGVAMLVWHQLLGTPVFREEDDHFTARVAAREPWAYVERVPTEGWVTVESRETMEKARDPAAEERGAYHSEPISGVIGDADVAELKLSQDEMAALMRGEIPDALIKRLLMARSTENLLDSVADALAEISEEPNAIEFAPLARARQELGEVRRRFGRV